MPDLSLRILVSAPGTDVPGLYRWRADAPQPKLLCPIVFPATFSFDRSMVIEREDGEASVLRIYSAANCRELATIPVEGRTLDVDARGHQVAVALRLPDDHYELRLYSQRGRVIATAAVSRNVEIGFAPDGRSLVNFDLSDGNAALWRLPMLATMPPPAGFSDNENTFVPGSAYVKQYANQTLSVSSWPGGKALYTVPASRAVRIRALSANGRFGMLHERQTAGESLDWIDFATKRRVTLATGSIDHATISATGSSGAWSARDPETANQVHVERTGLSANGHSSGTVK